MANELLKFRRGTYAQINAAERANGTIYIATDEKALYVDTATERIRIGDFIRVSTVKDITPPYSASSLYYVESDNALLKYDGNVWKQVNGTDDLKQTLNSLTNRVATNESDISGLKGRMTTAEGKITTLENTVGKPAEGENAATGLIKDIADLKKAVGMGDNGDVEGIGSTVTQLAIDLNALEAKVQGTDGNGGMVATLADHTSRISTAETDIENLEGALNNYKTTVSNTYVTKNELANEKQALQAEIDADVAAEAALRAEEDTRLANLISENKSLAEAALTKEAFNTFKNENTTAINNAKTGAVSEANGYTDGKITAEEQRADGKYATKTALEATNNTVSGNISAIGTINETLETKANKADVESTYVKKADADAKLAKIDTTKTVSESIADAVAAEAAIARAAEQANANAAAGALSAAQDAQGDATEALTKIGDASNGLVKDIADNKAAAAAAQKTADDYITEHKNDYTNKQIDDNIKVVSDIVAGHASTLESLTGDDGLVAEAKAAADAAQKTVDDYIKEHKNDYTNKQIDDNIKVAKDAADVADGKAVANASKISTLESKVSDLETNSATKTELSEAETRLTNKISNEINAANAMEYKGGVASEDDLDKKTNVKSGDTYVATGAFEFSDGRIALPGDLVIATGTEVNGVIAVPTWEIVHTGYDASLEQEIKTVNGKIQLTSKVGNANNGQISFVAEANSAAKVSVANNTVTIGMVWDDFT